MVSNLCDESGFVWNHGAKRKKMTADFADWSQGRRHEPTQDCYANCLHAPYIGCKKEVCSKLERPRLLG